MQLKPSTVHDGTNKLHNDKITKEVHAKDEYKFITARCSDYWNPNEKYIQIESESDGKKSNRPDSQKFDTFNSMITLKYNSIHIIDKHSKYNNLIQV